MIGGRSGDIPSVYIKIALLVHIYTLMDNKQDQSLHDPLQSWAHSLRYTDR